MFSAKPSMLDVQSFHARFHTRFHVSFFFFRLLPRYKVNKVKETRYEPTHEAGRGAKSRLLLTPFMKKGNQPRKHTCKYM
jgi:hypothetical protein